MNVQSFQTYPSTTPSTELPKSQSFTSPSKANSAEITMNSLINYTNIKSKRESSRFQSSLKQQNASTEIPKFQ